MQNAYRNRTGPGVGSFFVVAAAAFALVFALGIFRPGASTPSFERFQAVMWRMTNLRINDLNVFGFRPFSSMLSTASASAPAPGKAAPSSDTRYEVVSGDTLSIIAGRFGVETSALIARNQLSNPNQLEIGQALWIPGIKVEGRAAAAEPAQVASARSVSGPVQPVALPAVSSAPPPAASEAASPVDALLAMAEEELHAARFDRALHTTEAVERLLIGSPAPEAGADATRRARMEVVRATAYAAVGHQQQVQHALAKALVANPDLTLDPATTPPKLIQALEVTRQMRAVQENEAAKAEAVAAPEEPTASN